MRTIKYLLIVIVFLFSLSTSWAANLVTNGDFEFPDVATDDYDLLVESAVPGWGLLRGTDAPTGWGNGQYIEIQDSWNSWHAYSGTQLAELDAGGAGSSIYQDLATTPGVSYSLSFAFSPRPQQSLADNVLGVMWDGSVVDTLSASGVGLLDTSWTYYSYTLTATTSNTRLIFGDAGQHDSAGTFLDSVSVSVVPEPISSTLFIVGGAILGFRRFKRSSHDM